MRLSARGVQERSSSLFKRAVGTLEKRLQTEPQRRTVLNLIFQHVTAANIEHRLRHITLFPKKPPSNTFLQGRHFRSRKDATWPGPFLTSHVSTSTRIDPARNARRLRHTALVPTATSGVSQLPQKKLNIKRPRTYRLDCLKANTDPSS